MSEAPFLRQWILVVRRIRLGRTVKAVATMLATYADPDGSRVFPGVARLSHECELSYTVVKGALRTLRNHGLIVKVGKRGDADEYRLILHEDLLERVNVPTPAQADMEIERIRKAWKGTYSPGLRSTRTPADNDEEEGLRSTALTAESPDVEESAVNGNTPETGSAVNGSTDLRSMPLTATEQDRPPTKTEHSDEDLRTDVAVVGGSPPNEDPDFELAQVIPIMPKRGPCPHGNSPKRRRDGQPRCDQCRDQSDVSDPQPELGASKCIHGLKVAVGGDGQPRCFACRRGLPGAV